jgi:hypothetical protein
MWAQKFDLVYETGVMQSNVKAIIGAKGSHDRVVLEQ